MLNDDEARRISQGVTARPEEDTKYVDEHARAALLESTRNEDAKQLQSWANMISLPTTKLHEYSRATDLHQRQRNAAIVDKDNALVQRDEAVAKQEELTAHFKAREAEIRDFCTAQNKKRDQIIARHVHTIAEREQTIAEYEQPIAEYEQTIAKQKQVISDWEDDNMESQRNTLKP
jgi:uncharacterized protein (DUF3084 family)